MDQINPQTFQMLMDRFDRIDKDNDELKKMIVQHAVKDESYYRQTEQHAGYFRVLWVGLTAVGGMMLALWGAITPTVVQAWFK